jgi:(1->4)-alpha-D-glucan 1-alpha-D-glucosylmutase
VYTPLQVHGARTGHAIAYLRNGDVATIVPRLTKILAGDWQGTTAALPEGRWSNRLTGAKVSGGAVPLQELLKDFPVALLVRE